MAYIGNTPGSALNTLNDLTDVNVGNATDNQAVVYDSDTSKFVNATLTTTNIVEGSNLFYTKDRVDSDITTTVDSDYVQSKIPIASARTIGQVFASSSSSITVDSFKISDYRSAVYNIQITSPLGYESLELRVVHDDVVAHSKISLLSNLDAFDLNQENLSVKNQSRTGDIHTYVDYIDSEDNVIFAFTPYYPNTYVNYERLVHPNVGSPYIGRTDLSTDGKPNVDLSLYDGRINLALDSSGDMDLLHGSESYDLNTDNFNDIDLF